MHACRARASLNRLTVIRVFRKVRNTRHQKVEFDPTPGEIKEKPAKEYIISIQMGVKKTQKSTNFLWSTEFHPGFSPTPFQRGLQLCFKPYKWIASAPPLLLHIFSLALIYTVTVITLELCALNAVSPHPFITQYQ